MYPKPFLTALRGKPVAVKLKWGVSFTGILVSEDNFMNLHLAGTEEYVDGKKTGAIGEVLIRYLDFAIFIHSLISILLSI